MGTEDVSANGQNEQTVRTFFRLMHQKDIDGWALLWCDDAVITTPYPVTGFPKTTSGREAIVGGFKKLFSNFSSYDYSINALYKTTDADVIVVEWTVSASIKSTETTYKGENITVFIMREGKIAQYHDYFNPTLFAKVIEALPE